MHQKIKSYLLAHKRPVRWLLLGGGVIALLPLLAMLVGYLWIHPYQRYVLDARNTQLVQAKNVRVGLVMGAGVTKHGKPFRELQARLDVAAEAYRAHPFGNILAGSNLPANTSQASYGYLGQHEKLTIRSHLPLESLSSFHNLQNYNCVTKKQQLLCP